MSGETCAPVAFDVVAHDAIIVFGLAPGAARADELLQSAALLGCCFFHGDREREPSIHVFVRQS
jgi:hypothetical protein